MKFIAKIKSFWDGIIMWIAFFLMPFAIIFFLVIYLWCRENAMRFMSWWYGILDFDFLAPLEQTSNSYPQQDHATLYGMHGGLTEWGNQIVREITGNCLSFYVGTNENGFTCFLKSTDGRNSPYRHLLMNIIRKNNYYPISIRTCDEKIYEGINTENSLKIAIKEILLSNETKNLIEAMMFVFWGRYQNDSESPTRDALISIHGEKFVSKYEELSNLRKRGKLIFDQEREELIRMHRIVSPHFATTIGECESSDIDRLSWCLMPKKG